MIPVNKSIVYFPDTNQENINTSNRAAPLTTITPVLAYTGTYVPTPDALTLLVAATLYMETQDGLNAPVALKAVDTGGGIYALPVSATIAAEVKSNASNTNITVTNASQQFLAANTSRKYLLLQNKDATGKIYVTFGAAATVANGVEIPAGGSYEPLYAPGNTVNIIGDIASNANIVIVEA